jgi:two-component system NtrC family sensor kinase
MDGGSVPVPARRAMQFFRTITFRVLVGSCLLLFVLFVLFSYFSVRSHNNQMMAQVYESADRISDVIKNSTHHSMLLNRREDVFQIIRTIGREQGVDGIRIYNERGRIMFSTDDAEEKSVVDMRAEACYGCHDSAEPLQALTISNRARVYRGRQGDRIIALINPIRNEPACSNAECHFHPRDRHILGVLDVRMSLKEVDANISRARSQFVAYALVITLTAAFASGLFLFFTVHRPVQKLMEGTSQLGSGNLEYRLSHVSQDELGELARSFNRMSEALQQAQKENQEWSETLEKRVEQKTAELQKIHEQLLQIEKMASLGKLSATIAHELNNPLEGILNYAKLISRRLRKEPEPPESSRQALEDLELVIREVQRCGNIVKNLLLFSKRQIGEFGVADARSIVEKAVQLIQHHLKISNVTFEGDYRTSDTRLMCNENEIQQALIALMVNAVEAMPGGGNLRLTMKHNAQGDLQIILADSGIGIAREDLPNIFEPFFTTKTGGQGTGLGLSVVYGIVERHGGTISVESEPGKGSTFTLTFPMAATAQSG